MILTEAVSRETIRYVGMTDPTVKKDALRFIPIAKPSVGIREAIAVFFQVLSGWISQGRRVAQFERVFTVSHGKQFGAACNSGTTALQLALAALDIGPGDLVLCPTFTMVAVANAILSVGARPVFYDSNTRVGNSWHRTCELTYAMHPEKKKIKALIVAHCYGEVTPGMEYMQAFANQNGLHLIEDCAEVHYAKGAGTFGVVACWSFFANKNITTGEGGMVTTDRRYIKERLDRIRMHAFSPEKHFNHTEHAYGFRMTDMQAVLGLMQHSRRRELMARRRRLREAYTEYLFSSGSERLPVEFIPTTTGSAWWVFPLLCEDERSRDALRLFLADRGVETRTYFVPMHKQQFLKCYVPEGATFKHSEDISARGLYLPLYPAMSVSDVRYICEAVLEWSRT